MRSLTTFYVESSDEQLISFQNRNYTLRDTCRNTYILDVWITGSFKDIT
jgi:hypothetical protein